MKMFFKVGIALAVLPLLNIAASAQTPTDKLTGLKLSNDEPIQIESDRLDVRDNESIAEFTGNVSVVQGPTLLKSGKMIVYYEKNGGSAASGSAAIDRLDISGKVYVQSGTQIATGDTAKFDMKSQVLVMAGSKVVLSDGDNVATGCKLTVQMKTGKAKLESCKGGSGRVQIVVNPKSAPKQ